MKRYFADAEKELIDRADTEISKELIEILQLKIKPNGRIDTAWGDKSPMGLIRTVRRIINGN